MRDKIETPLEKYRIRAKLTYGQLGAMFKLRPADMRRYCLGLHEPSLELALLLLLRLGIQPGSMIKQRRLTEDGDIIINIAVSN